MIPIHERPTQFNNYIPFMEWLASNIKPENYLELGVAFGDTLFKVAPHCKKATGVDIVLHDQVIQNKPDNVVLCNQSTNRFFHDLDKNEIFDLIFIDADHSYEQSKIDFINSSHHICNDGLIIMHDTYPPSKEYAINSICGEVYRTASFIKTFMTNKYCMIYNGDMVEWHTR